MRLASLVFLITLCGGPAVAGSALAPFSPTLPEGIGEVADWQIVSGEFETTEARGAYMFYVNPSRAAMYQLMRYQLEFTDPGSRPARQRRGAERVAFVRRPGSREPIECWEKRSLGATPVWRRIGAGTEEYKAEMAALLYVLGVHRAVRFAE
jgi:hypothetical protein